MTQFTNDYFRALPPRDRRYDTPVADQLVFRVFPNGVKAWVHVYPCDDFVRRRTMGLFPEMDYGAALAALEVGMQTEIDGYQFYTQFATQAAAGDRDRFPEAAADAADPGKARGRDHDPCRQAPDQSRPVSQRLRGHDRGRGHG